MRKKGHVDKTVGTHSNARLSRKACIPRYIIKYLCRLKEATQVPLVEQELFTLLELIPV